MVITHQLDWVSATYNTDSDMKQLFPMCDWRYAGEGRYGYKFAYQDRITGAMYQGGSGRDDMGVHLTLTGDALNRFRADLGATDDGLSKTISNHGARCSRIDLTINIHDGELSPRNVYDAYQAGDLTAKTKRARFIEGINGDVRGDTFYLGSPKSDRQFRAYNKSAELGIKDGQAWLRFELELRSLRAFAALESCASNGVVETVNGHMGDFAKWAHPEYKRALTGPSSQPVELPRRLSNRQRWLLGQVVKALASEVTIDPAFQMLFLSRFGQELRKLGHT